MKRTKLISLIIVCILTLFSFTMITGCGGNKEDLKVVNVSTAKEYLDAMGEKTKIILNNDIDFNGKTVQNLYSGAVDGQGHTISNVYVNARGYGYVFGVGTNNLTVDNIVMNVEDAEFAGLFGAVIYPVEDEKSGIGAAFSNTTYTYNFEMHNNHVKNCKITVSVAEDKAFYGGGLIGCAETEHRKADGERKIVISNCSVDNLELIVNGYSPINPTSYSGNMSDIYVGGIIGSGRYTNINNCSIKNSSISAVSGLIYDEIRIGGLTGILRDTSKIEQSYVQNCTVSAKSTWYQDNAVHKYSTSTTRVGGILGSSEKGSSITLCYSEANSIKSNCAGGYYVGGIGGVGNCSVNQSYSTNNTISCQGRVEGDENTDCKRYAGGLFGTASSTYLLSSFAYGNSLSDGDRSDIIDKEGKFAGFIADGTDLNLSNCAVGITAFIVPSDAKKDEFCVSTLSEELFNKSSCYITVSNAGNINKCSLLSTDDWLNPSVIKQALALSDTSWIIAGGSVPKLDFNV